MVELENGTHLKVVKSSAIHKLVTQKEVMKPSYSAVYITMVAAWELAGRKWNGGLMESA